MTKPSKINPEDYFIVRAKEGEPNPYTQHEGYGYFLAHVLDQLATEHIENAEDLVRAVAFYMSNVAEQPRKMSGNEQNGDYLLESLPEEIKQRWETNYSNLESDGFAMSRLFGSAYDIDFGYLGVEHIALTESHDAHRDFTYCQKNFVTGICKKKANSHGYRGYKAIVDRNIGDKVDLEKESITFSYKVPNKDTELELMTIGDSDNLEDKIADGYIFYYTSGDTFRPSEVIKKHEAFIFLHPVCDKQFMHNLYTCIDPLLKVVLDENNNHSLEEKTEALADIFWLDAQATPVMRGGTAHAHLVLRLLELIIKQQGYDFEIPLCKAGTDLWAEAATTNVETFRTRFVEGKYFEPKTPTQAPAKPSALEKVADNNLTRVNKGYVIQ